MPSNFCTGFRAVEKNLFKLKFHPKMSAGKAQPLVKAVSVLSVQIRRELHRDTTVFFARSIVHNIIAWPIP